MKIGILTFHCAANYGAVLQTYALQETLKRLGHEVYILDYRPEYLTNPYKAYSPYWKFSLKKLPRIIPSIYIRKKRLAHFKKFEADNLNVSDLTNYKDVDSLIVGSDQIWNPELTQGFDPWYFLDIDLPLKTKRISYAASAGGCKGFNANINKKLINALNKFNAISVREQRLKEILQCDDFIFNPDLVLDPVLLGGSDILETLTDRKFAPKEPYILTFSLFYDPDLRKYAERILPDNNTRIIEMISMEESPGHPKIIQNASIPKFLSLIKYANGIITSSFHGTAISILFNRPFISISYSKEHGDRVKSLLESINHSERQISKHEFSNSCLTFDMNYNEINSKIESMRMQSLRFLTDNI